MQKKNWKGEHIPFTKHNIGIIINIGTKLKLQSTRKDGRKHYYCPDCVVNKVDWCTKCGQPFEIDDKQLTTLCFKCREEVKIQNV